MICGDVMRKIGQFGFWVLCIVVAVAALLVMLSEVFRGHDDVYAEPNTANVRKKTMITMERGSFLYDRHNDVGACVCGSVRMGELMAMPPVRVCPV